MRPTLLAGLPVPVLLAAVLAACSEPPSDPDPAATPSPTSGSPAATPAPDADDSPPSSPSPSTSGWTRLESAPFARLEMATAAHDGEIWLVGGLREDGSATEETWRFDPATGEWREGPPLPVPIHHAALVSTGDELIVLGGYDGSGFDAPRATVLVLEPSGNHWVDGTDLPEPRAAGAAAWDGGRIVYGGGVGPGGLAADVFALEDGAWSRLGAMRSGREHLSATSDGDGRVWLLGGRALSLDANTAAVDLVEDLVMTRIGDLPTARGGTAAFHLPGVGACLTGGESPDRAHDEVECVDADGTPRTLPSLDLAVHGHGAAVVDGDVYVVLGGPEPGLSATEAVQRLDR